MVGVLRWGFSSSFLAAHMHACKEEVKIFFEVKEEVKMVLEIKHVSIFSILWRHTLCPRSH